MGLATNVRFTFFVTLYKNVFKKKFRIRISKRKQKWKEIDCLSVVVIKKMFLFVVCSDIMFYLKLVV